MTVTPSGRSNTSIRRLETTPISPSAAAMSSGGIPSSCATAAAASVLLTWCRPTTPSRTRRPARR
jgi:hypothetical protein